MTSPDSIHGSIHWSELVSADVEGSKAFFTDIAGWTISEVPMPDGVYNLCMQGDQPVAGIVGIEQMPADPAVSPHWMTYIAVDDVDASLARVASLGGAVIRPAFDVPGVGRIAIISDPGQGVVGIMAPAEG